MVGTTTPYLIVAADVDGDGRLDLVTTEVSANLVSVFRNLATPGSLSSNSFAPRVSFLVGSGPRALAVADLDGDGRPEIVSANYGSSTVSILRNVSSPGQISSNSFAPRLDLPTGSGTHGLALADLDGDGKPDIATANAAANTISLLRNLATPGSLTSASFAPAVVLAGPTYPHFLRAADLDGDGKLELILTSYMGQSVSVYLNRATPGTLTPLSFAPRVEFALGARGHTISIGDLNGDSKPDVVVDCEIPDRVCVFQNLGVPGSFTSGSFAARVDLPGGYNVWGSSVGDLDGDSRPDILVANSYDNNISIYRNLGSLPPTITQQPTTQSVVLGDWVMFNVLATGTSPFSYQWRFNGDAIAGATNNSLVLPEAQLSQAGDYSVTVANAAGSVLSSNATLTVNVPVCTTALSGLVAWWSSENNALDSVGTNNGLPVGGISYTNGKAGQAFVFDQSSSYISVPASPSLNIGTGSGITIEVWVKPQPGVNAPIIEWDSATTDGLQLWIANFNTALFANVKDTAGNAHTISFPYIFNTNNFQHVAMTYDKSSGLARLFINGAIVASTNFGTITPQTTYPANIGRRTGQPIGLNDTYGGAIDELSLYNRALTTNEIAAIYAARGAGKCPLPPTVLSVTPTNWYVNEGSTVSYTVTAVGSPVLTYQWQQNGSDIAGATNATLTLSNVVYAQAGNYAVVVSNPGGMDTSSNVLLRVNRAPVADASATDTLAISPNGTNAVVVLDGSRSSDPDGDALTYAWFNFGDTNAFATSIVAMESLPVGTNQVILTVNDGMAWNSQSIAIEVITTSQALDRLIALVQSGSGNTQPLVASLRAALAAIDRSQPAVAINQLEAFINKV
ncbi:MAG TPA: FG-GAP-like repeat-containing protein, partial [bacterium]|nr:FG-GAP-like repeat-containing protein [bacterium]